MPIKRSKYIIELSRDHHSGLLFCWKIKEGVKKGIDFVRIKSYINFFWEHYLKEHFREEETLLFDELNDPLTTQARQEHELLTDWINRLNHNGAKNDQGFLSFAELMIKHIRFEERVLFPHLEKELPVSTLEAVSAYLERQHQAPLKEDYPDRFWEE